MTVVHALSRRSIDQLEDAIIDHSKRLNATEYEFLELVREFDIRQGWKAYHFNSCAEWLNLKCGIVVGTAREKVRVAMALFELPGISKSFASGDLSYSKVRSLSRIATPHNEARLLDYALDATAEQVQTHCQRLRNADRRASTTDANQIHRERYLSRSLDGSGRMTISVELTQEAGELVMAALERAMSDASRDGSDEESVQVRQADALVDMARSYLAGGTEKSTSSAEHYQVVVHVDEATLRETTHEEAKSDLPLESVRRLCCDASVVTVTQDAKGNPLDVGRKHRVVQPALRRALLARDRCCRYPGCTHRKWLDAHHVMHWVDGGKTSLENTLLLCDRHHRLLHEGGYRIRTDHRGELFFQTARGKVVV